MQSPHEPAGKTLPELLREYADELLTEKRRGVILRKVREMLAATEKKEAKAAAEFIARGNAAWDAMARRKALVENRGKTSYNAGMDSLNEYLKSLGVPQSRQPQLAAKIDRFAKAEITGREAAPQLNVAALAAFKKHAKENPWNPDSGAAPSAFIKKTFAKWLGRGLGLTDIRAAQSNLAGAYSAEISRDTRKQVKGLYVRPHKLPAGLAVAVRRVRHVADLSEKEAAANREKKTAAQRRWRTKRRKDELHLAM